MMRFEFYTFAGEMISGAKIISYELTSDMGAACDGLRVYFYTDLPPDDISDVFAFENGSKVFNGFADQFQLALDQNGYTAFVYARSSAALLVDNEADPGQYDHPTSRQLWFENARPFGFAFGLPEVFSDGSYVVNKGTSCFGAINSFMQYVCSKNIYVDAYNRVKVFEYSSNVKKLSENEIISLSKTTDKSSVISRIDYKINSADQYIYRLESRKALSMGIRSRLLINLSSLPPWQRDAEAHRRISDSLCSLNTVKAVLSGSRSDLSLADRVRVSEERLGINGIYYIYGMVRSKDQNGEKTVLTLRTETDGELINYVAEQKF